MHVKDARKFVASTPHRVVPGDTLVFDFVFFLHPVRVLLAGQGGWCQVRRLSVVPWLGAWSHVMSCMSPGRWGHRRP